MELCSLHPFDESSVSDFVRRVQAEGSASAAVTQARSALARLERGEERGRYELTYALAGELAALHPSFTDQGFSLTAWEARIDRGVGMLMRPPARLLIDAGLAPPLARPLPIRLELTRGMMGGAYIPARLVPDLERVLDEKLERTVRRMLDAEMNPMNLLGLMVEAAGYARANGLGLFESMDVAHPDSDPTLQIVTPDKKRLDKVLRSRIELASKPPKKPGLWARLTGRAKPDTHGFPEDGGDGG